MEQVLNEFLAAHPEHIPGHARVAAFGPGHEDALDHHALRAFLPWAVRVKGADPVKARAQWAALQRQYPESFVGELDL